MIRVMTMKKLLTISVLALTIVCSGSGVQGAPPQPKAGEAELTAQQREELGKLIDQFREAGRASKRRIVIRKIGRLGAPAIRQVMPIVEEQLKAQEKQYAELLSAALPDAYLKHLARLSDRQIYHTQKVRRVWKPYILKTSGRHAFQNDYLTPCMKAKDILLLDVKRVANRELAAQRGIMQEYASYVGACRKALGLGSDPTEGRKAPTGIDIPHLDQPPTFADNLAYLDRSMVLAHTVAPEGARAVLLANAQRARQIDVQEAEFVLFANEVRMLVGSIAWEVDPLACAATRDHSTDRKEGRASGHSSTVPGKEGFTARMRRFGSSARSEGAGGGKSGRGYIWGLSYGGGHTGPLYGLVRNVTGCGRRGGVYTSVYRTNKAIRHPCAATEGELFLPPGFTGKRVRSEALKAIYGALKAGKFGKAHALMAAAREREPDQVVIQRFFAAAIKMEGDWLIECVNAIANAGDVCAAKDRLAKDRPAFDGNVALERKLDRMALKFQTGRMAKEVTACEAYHKLAAGEPTREQLIEFAKQYRGTVAAKAAQHNMQDTAERNALSFFFAQNPSLRKFEYRIER